MTVRAVGGRNAYKPIVKLMRQARRTHSYRRKRRPGGLFVEFAIYEAWNSGRVAGERVGFALCHRPFGRSLSGSRTPPWFPLHDPALGMPVEPAVAEKDLANAAAVFSELADKADAALTADDCQAAVKWRDILGGNDRAEYVFLLPPRCDASGNRIRTATAGGSRQEARPFG